MHHPTKVFVPLLLAIGLAGCHQTAAPTNTNPGDTKSMDTNAKDVADLKALEERFNAAFKAKDVNAIMQFCVPDESLVVFDVHTPRQFNGAQAYRKDWEDLFNQFSGPIEADISEMDVTAGGDVAYAHYIHHVVGTTKSGKKADTTVRVTDCFKKINGKWLIAHSHISVPVDMRTGKADLESKP